MSLNKIFIKAITLVISLLLWSCHVSEKESENITLSAQLVRVVSGQTIEVIIPERDNRSQQVRLIGVDVPKSKDTLQNEQARTKLKELLTTRTISLELESSDLDRYNRILAHVWHNKTLVSEQLAKEGYVIANNKYPHQYRERIFHAQEYARILGYGIWQ